MTTETQEAGTMDGRSRSTVTVTFNGTDKAIAFEQHERVEAVLNRAMDAFGIQSNRHLMAFFTEVGLELPVDTSMRAAGVVPGQLLILRQSIVRGG